MSQSLTQSWIHIIFSTKDRYPFLQDQKIQQRMHVYIGKICDDLKCQPSFVGGTADHIHILTNLNKNLPLSTFIEKVKKSSSKWIKTVDCGNNIINQFYWQRGYAAFSVSQSAIDAVKQYIATQAKHHQKQNFQDELRKWLSANHITYDERYLWD